MTKTSAVVFTKARYNPWSLDEERKALFEETSKGW